jgi:hypothetical protein
MDKFELVLQKLKRQNLNPEIKSTVLNGNSFSEITWIENSNDECFIYEGDIAIEENKVAWFQSSNEYRHLLTVYENETVFNWMPKTYNPVFGCYCLLIEWYKQHLIFIYQEKHDIYVCSIKNGNVNFFNFHGEEIERKGDLISYETYMNKSDKVRLLKIPELVELEPIDKLEAEKLGIVPIGLNRPGNFLGNK